MNESPSQEKAKKPETRRVTVAFEKSTGCRSSSDDGKRPKSAGFLDFRQFDREGKSLSGRKQQKQKVFDMSEGCCWREARCSSESFPDFESRCSSAFEDSWPYCEFLAFPTRKCRSNPSFTKSFPKCDKDFHTERDFHKVKRSLKLLGFELSDFGIYNGRRECGVRRRPKPRSPTFSTKITDRSVSLDSVREVVKKAWLEDCLDDSHRRLLSQAAYEEWYFRKEREIWKKRNEERRKLLKAKMDFQIDFQRKKQKSEEEFQKWLQRKREKRKMQKEPQKQGNFFSRLIKTKEESQEAFIKWKKNKEKELEIKKKEKRKEEEMKKESERQKAEKRIIAEKAYQQWKIKLEEFEKQEEAKRQKIKREQEAEMKRRREEGTRISFQMWKAAKDEEIKQKIKQMREAEKAAREERLAQMEERMYEAEQAFEDWLERTDLRRQKQFYTMNAYQKMIPWIPV